MPELNAPLRSVAVTKSDEISILNPPFKHLGPHAVLLYRATMPADTVGKVGSRPVSICRYSTSSANILFPRLSHAR